MSPLLIYSNRSVSPSVYLYSVPSYPLNPKSFHIPFQRVISQDDDDYDEDLEVELE